MLIGELAQAGGRGLHGDEMGEGERGEGAVYGAEVGRGQENCQWREKRERSTVLVKQAEKEKRGEGRKKERRGRGRFLQKREKVQGMHLYSLVLKKERKGRKKRGRKEPVRTSQGTCEEGEDRRKRGGESKKSERTNRLRYSFSRCSA